MGYANLQSCLRDLEQTGQLVRIQDEVDPYLEAAEIQRRVYQAGGPAILYERVKDCRFPMVSNLFGTLERTRFLFRDTIELVRRLVDLKIDPTVAMQRPLHYGRAFPVAWAMQPKFVRSGPAIECETTLDQLPQLQSWPDDGGSFITLPAVYSENPDRPGWQKSNLGMYRVQLAGNEYALNRQVGLHYQIHRSIGVQHAAAIRRGEPFRVNIFVGGPPALPLSAVMPLPEGLSELTFAGAMSGRRLRMIRRDGGLPIAAEADFCIVGTVDPDRQLPEGPFGDHLGYYSLVHDFPVLNVEKVYHRRDAVWPFTVVGRPPQEDTSFGEIIHEITGPAIPSVLPGVKAVHAVDAAGVHPLLLAIGSERYVPYAAERTPQELLTQANAILGQGQLSLAKYLLIVAGEDNPDLEIHDIAAFLRHLLERVDWERDLHFQTRTTIDTLDYSGEGFNQGSKLVIAAAGAARRELGCEVPSDLTLPDRFRDPHVVLPGVLAVSAPKCSDRRDGMARRFCEAAEAGQALSGFPLIVLVDDAEFTARTLSNFLWVTFTRSNPAADIDGIGSFTEDKHWGCRGALVIDARIKPHHAPPLIEDPEVTRRVDQLGAPGGPLHGVL
ncbi:4-hydroxybenzoate decarboxylase subunit C [Maioricimonas rarisocia]|uniref:4-hydroxybenzoate decarboxylase subunit C n=1 Tax=Maioricimonas rarisocia TaxID=2528026 RepID=A0A517Z439_9PLAN|nr:UbiD family decarboxylase [Maioricimonas rarisocia]QDU37231.1 4-hydroxybenzoate decarboxylase subunit C [Maioricimonas rarisocia]